MYPMRAAHSDMRRICRMSTCICMYTYMHAYAYVHVHVMCMCMLVCMCMCVVHVHVHGGMHDEHDAHIYAGGA